MQDDKTCDVPVNQVYRASNHKTIDLTELPYLNEPEILSKIKNNVYLDRQVLIQSVNSTLVDFIQYKKYIDERLIINQVPPHIFSSLFFAYINLDLGKSSQLFITGNQGYGKTQIITDLVSFLSKDYVVYYNLIKSLITNKYGHTQGVVNYRFIYKQKQLVGFVVQLHYIDTSDYENMEYFQQNWQNLPSVEVQKAVQTEEKIENGQQYQKFVQQIIDVMNGLTCLNDNILMISILDYPGQTNLISNYISEQIEQIYLQHTFKNCQQLLIQDQLSELYNQIQFEDNKTSLENLEQQNEIPQSLVKLNSILVSKDIQLLYIRCLKERQDLKQYRILDSIKFFQSSYPHRMNYNEFYQRFHHLDVFNRKITLQKHLSSNQDMKALVREISKRITQAKGLLFGQNQVYFKKEAFENINKLLCSHNKKLNTFAKIIQKAFRVRQFKMAILSCVKRIKSNEQEIAQKSELKQPQTETQNQTISQEIQWENMIEISDLDSYQLLNEEQLEQYKKTKINHLQLKQRSMLDGTLYEEIQNTAFQLLNEEQLIQRKSNIQKNKIEQQLKELEAIEKEVSDQESFSLLTFEQKLQYLNLKKQDQTQVAFKLLDQNQQHQIKQSRRIQKMKELQDKIYTQLDPFLSDIEAYKQLTTGQQNEYKKQKLENKKNVAKSLLNEQQKTRRIEIIINQRTRQMQKKQFLIDDYLSDPESFTLLEQEQRKVYTQQKQESLPLRLLSNKVKFGYDIDISDPESFKLLENKEEYLKYKEKLSLFNDISDIEAYLSITNVNEYINRKREGLHSISKELANTEQYEMLKQQRFRAQQRLDELNLIRHDLLDSTAFRLLNDEQWKVRKQFLLEQNVNEGIINIESIAFQNLSIEKKNKRKIKEQVKIKMKDILNPILFENHLHPKASVAYRLLENKDIVYKNISLAYSLLKDKNVIDQHLKELIVYSWEEVRSYKEKQELLQQKINRYEKDKQDFSKVEFSDYEAFLLLDEDQLKEYKNNAYCLLDNEQKQIHRRIMKSKLKSDSKHSDLESYAQLSDDSKLKYTQMKVEDVSDQCAYEALENKQQYEIEKQNRKINLNQIKQNGFKIYFGQIPKVLTIEEYEKFINYQQQIQKQIEQEEDQYLKQQIEEEKRKHKKCDRKFVIQSLIENPHPQNFVIYEKAQQNKKLLDIRSTIDKNLNTEFDNGLLQILQSNLFKDYCQQVLHQQGNQIEKIMKCQTDNIKKPLTKISNEGVALNVFKSITKFAHMKRSSLTTKEHLERILCSLIGTTAQIELPTAPKSLQRSLALDIDTLKRSIELETTSRKFNDGVKLENNQEIREEIFLQIFKQIEGNTKEHLYYLLRLCIVITHCIPLLHPLPFIQYLIEQLQKPENKFFKEPDMQKYTKQIIKNLSINTDVKVFKDEIKTQLCARVYLPSKDELQLMFECKQPIVKLMIHSDTPLWVELEHNFSVQQVIKQACSLINQQDNWMYFGLMVAQSKTEVIYNTSYVDQFINFFDILNKLEFHEEINNNVYKLNKRFDIYLRIKKYIQFEEDDQDLLDLYYYQLAFDVKRNRFNLKEDELSLLQELEIYIKYGENQIRSKYNLKDPVAAKLQFLKIIELSTNSSLENIIK
ncbi:unnamed protein product (macronuclear) [Paramecium tetraurelia]|uniref:FERM domain-containing protein n=1 Tax=Paramecium tetraurelia TaxID=5888 RepID=A0DXH2_PARTE|nr:uncharacterized protein GSPATT00021372001 [Paramecium tetraurelia]CAK87739.1 unnamed protein product [Paramecium tetraurelia]|eukprot:XP_001455136.1 hypothetical protein (macronuclear) [Paramecium tetraurelia strain d4-2]